jgi:beta-galactosidase GanA
MWRSGVRCDIVRLDKINDYKMLLLSNTVVIGKDTARTLLEYVKNGGVIVCDGKIGITDELSMMNSMLPGGEFNEAMGCEYVDCDYEGLDFVCEETRYRGFYGRELLRITDGEVTGRFADGHPAVIEKSFGKGKVITVATYMWYSQSKGEVVAEQFASALDRRFGLSDISVSAPLHARICENDDGYFAFVFNYSDTPVSGEVKGYGIDETVDVPANDVIILRREKK